MSGMKRREFITRETDRGRGDRPPVVTIGGAYPRGGSPMFDIRRREFITLLGGAAAAWPLAAQAQPVKTLPTIGFLGASTSLNWTHWTNAFMRRLGELGWIDGRTVTIEYRWAEGRSERFAEIAAEFVRLRVDVIVTSGTPQVLAVKQDIGHPDRVRDGCRSGRHRPSGQSGATGRQRHPACRSSTLILPGSDSNSCVRSFPVCAGWRS